MTRVIFRAVKSGQFKDNITAVFIDELYNENIYGSSMLNCYQRIGQHGPCSKDWLFNDTRPAKQSEYASLLKELTELVGYDDLEIVNNLRGTK